MMVLISETVAGLKYFSLDFDEASIVSNGGQAMSPVVDTHVDSKD